MTRNSRHLDQNLIQSALILLPQTGCQGLSIRQVTEHAGVNLGMFHYHFKNKDTFLTQVLQTFYEQLFQQLTHDLQAAAQQQCSPLQKLRVFLQCLGEFSRKNRRLIIMLMMDGVNGYSVVIQFAKNNIHRHLSILHSLLQEGQQVGEIVEGSIINLVGFIAGSVGASNLVSVIFEHNQAVEPETLNIILENLLNDKALQQRINLAIKAISTKP